MISSSPHDSTDFFCLSYSPNAAKRINSITLDVQLTSSWISCLFAAYLLPVMLSFVETTRFTEFDNWLSLFFAFFSRKLPREFGSSHGQNEFILASFFPTTQSHCKLDSRMVLFGHRHPSAVGRPFWGQPSIPISIFPY